jgi:hypothetical protein
LLHGLGWQHRDAAYINASAEKMYNALLTGPGGSLLAQGCVGVSLAFYCRVVSS